MKLVSYISLVALLLIAPALAADKVPKPQKPPKPPPAPKVRPNGGPIVHPPNPQVEKLAKMSPAEREKALASLPADKRAKLEAGLERLKNLTPAQKEKLQKFYSLPPQQQKEVRTLALKMRALPDDRKTIVRREIVALQKMPPEEREKRVNSPGFQKKFTPEEQDILREYPTLIPENYF